MKRNIVLTMALLALAGCNRWGSYEFKSEKFSTKILFPDKWEVWDKSDDSRDFLVANYPNKPEAKIEVTSVHTAPDIETNEIYPTFESGGDDAVVLQDFGVDEKGTVSAANVEGRFIKVHWSGDKKNMRGYRAIFICNRYMLTLKADMVEDDYTQNEMDFLKMVRLMQL